MKLLSVAYVVASLADLSMTKAILDLGGGEGEANPIANAALSLGFSGMVLYKVAIVALVLWTCFSVSKVNAKLGNGVLAAGVAITSAVAVYGAIGFALLSYEFGGEWQVWLLGFGD